jgi:hypothetical protein
VAAIRPTTKMNYLDYIEAAMRPGFTTTKSSTHLTLNMSYSERDPGGNSGYHSEKSSQHNSESNSETELGSFHTENMSEYDIVSHPETA